MERRDLILKAWGTALHTFSASSLETLRFSDSTKAFLRETGLPTSTGPGARGLGFEFAPDDFLLPLEVDPPGEEPLHAFAASWYEGDLCISEPSGKVVRIDGELETTLLNSSIEQFLAYVALIEEFVAETDADGRSRVEARSKLRSDLAEVDPQAWNAEWWHEVLGRCL